MSLKFVYTNPDSTISVVHAVPKEHLERVFPGMTDDEYYAHVLERSIPKDAINVREILEEDMPTSREYRNAWCDVTSEKSIDLDLVKVKDIILAKVRDDRNEKLAKSDGLVARAIESGTDIAPLRAKRQELRDSTNALKAVSVSPKDVNSKAKLDEIELAIPVLVDIV